MAPISILFVDDNSTFLSIATRFLQAHPDVVVIGTATGGHDALAQARRLRPDVVLVDLAMPDLPGLEVIPRLREMLPDVAIIVLTLLEGNGYKEAALAAGADDFVSKSTLFTDLVPAIRRAAGEMQVAGDKPNVAGHAPLAPGGSE